MGNKASREPASSPPSSAPPLRPPSPEDTRQRKITSFFAAPESAKRKKDWTPESNGEVTQTPEAENCAQRPLVQSFALPPELLRMVIDFALPSCFRRFSPKCWSRCRCPSCKCRCSELKPLAAKLRSVCYAFDEDIRARLWECCVVHWTTFGPNLQDRFVIFQVSGQGQLVHKLRLPDVSNAWVSQPCLLLSLLPNLTTLTLDSLKHDDLALAAACVSGIEHLTISRVECSDEAVRDLLGALPKLRSFVFRGDPGKHLSASFFSGIVHHISPTLESFCFGPWDWDSCFEPEMGFALNDAHLATLTTRLEKLSKLVLRCCRELTDASVGPALAKFEDLVYLDLMYCENVGDAAIAEFKGAGLVALLLGETNASDESLVPVLKANHGLVRVDLDYTAAGNLAIEALASNCKSLSHFSLRGVDAVSSPSLVKLMEASPPLSCLILNGVDGVNDDVVRAIGEHLRGLERLSLIGCDGIKREEAVLFAAFLLRDSLSHFFLEDAEVSSERLDHALSLVLEDCSMEVWNEDEYEDESDDESEAEDDED